MANQYYCSDGTRVTQSTIDRRYAQAREDKYAGYTTNFRCGAGCGETGNHNDHTIAQARCKVIHKTELIWHKDNFVWSCAKCHKQWENFKSGEWVHHANVEQRLAFLKEHDPEGYQVRIELTQQFLYEKEREGN